MTVKSILGNCTLQIVLQVHLQVLLSIELYNDFSCNHYFFYIEWFDVTKLQLKIALNEIKIHFRFSIWNELDMWLRFKNPFLNNGNVII